MLRFAMGLLAAILGAQAALAGEVPFAPLPEAEARRIFDVAPEKATAAPKKPRKVLVFWRTPGFKHTVIPCTNAAIEVLGRKTGAYQTVTSDDPAVFEPAKLAEFDAVIMNNTCGKNVKAGGRELVREIFLPLDFEKLSAEEQQAALEQDARLKKSFEAFVRGGKGLVGLHGATGAFFSWPAYGEMLGAYFKWHPAPQPTRIKLDDPTHPLLAAFGGKGWEMKEETYVVAEPYSRETLRVLLTLENTEMMSKGPRPDHDYALAWIKRYGEGRTFYCAFSHLDENFRNPALLRFYLDGIQYALGDLDADATPSAKRAAK
jgi:type 1 glutamine amidotransferase